jgi:rfaE bifunctional protein nucleotidyltransferase chain/domain
MTGEGRFRPAGSKVVSLEEAQRRVAEWRGAGETIAYANGCFDLLHLGHVRTLESAKREADVLVVGVNGDESARRLKGPGRPVMGEDERAELVGALGCVDLVVVFGELTSMGVLEALRPEVWVKGGDYVLDSVNQQERAYVESYGGRVALGERVAGVSTTDVVARVRRMDPRES